MKPDYLVIGAMKCGTSTVCAYLEDHPQAFMLPRAEPNFFCDDAIWAKGTDWYEALFAEAAGEARMGEGSNDYASGARYPETAARIAGYDPDMRLIYIARHPLKRLISAWQQNRRDRLDNTPATLDAALEEQPEIFLDQSLYWKNLGLYRAQFPDAQIHLGFMEDLQSDPEGFFAGICAFLGLDPAPAERPHMNKSEGRRVPTPLYSKIKALPGMGAVKSMLPSGLKRAVRQNLLSKPVVADKPPAFSPRVHARVVEELRADAAAFLAHAGKPADYWDIR